MQTQPLNKQSDSRLAGLAQALYLLNISFLPIISFLVLVSIYIKKQPYNNPVVQLHFRQSILACIVAGLLLLVVSGIILFIGDFTSPYTWATLIIYFTCIHSGLILFGVFALIKSLALQNYVYPIFGHLWS